MTDYSFCEGIPTGFVPDFESGIFHDQRHLQLQSTTDWHSFVLLNNKKQTIDALIHYHVEGAFARSPRKSPFGSFIFSKSIKANVLNEFILFTEQQLKERGVRSVLIKSPPEVYAPIESKLLREVLSGLGYEIQSEEISAVIEIGNTQYFEILHRSKKPRLNKGKREFEFHELHLDRLEEVYNFILKCREGKGYSLSMSLVELLKLTQTFPEYFFLHIVKYKNEIIAASITILVMPHVLYTFYYDHAKKFDAASPIVYLCEGLYQFCQARQIKLLDLGTSMSDGKLAESLLDFKLSLGAQVSRKLTFIKNLS